ncbi:MAG TPA: M43 family zinc metalloprotease [Ignavibacteriaceae bacterium]
MLRLTDEFNQWLQQGNKVTTSGTVRIPVAFHIIRRNDGSGDVTDGQINGQITVLNSGFANTNFRFALHSIERVNNTTWSTQAISNSQVEAEMKEALTIDPSHTLNFYTSTNEGLTTGFARFPWEFSDEGSYMHGVIVKYTKLGTTGIHEVGHYVGLWHTFENGCYEPGDEVSDTPFEALGTVGCPTSKESCGSEDPIHNFMDYSTCRDHFTTGQSDRMDLMMEYHRPSIYYPVNVIVDQQREDGSRLSGTYIGYWNGSSFDDNQIYSGTITLPFL